MIDRPTQKTIMTTHEIVFNDWQPQEDNLEWVLLSDHEKVLKEERSCLIHPDETATFCGVCLDKQIDKHEAFKMWLLAQIQQMRKEYPMEDRVHSPNFRGGWLGACDELLRRIEEKGVDGK